MQDKQVIEALNRAYEEGWNDGYSIADGYKSEICVWQHDFPCSDTEKLIRELEVGD